MKELCAFLLPFVLPIVIKIRDKKRNIFSPLLFGKNSTLLQSNTQSPEISFVIAATIPSAEDQQSSSVLDIGQESRQVARMTGSNRMRKDHRTAETRDAYRLRQCGRSETQRSVLNVSLHLFVTFGNFKWKF